VLEAFEVAAERPQALQQRLEGSASAGFARIQVDAVRTAHDRERDAGGMGPVEPMFDVVSTQLEDGAHAARGRPQVDGQQVK
jgi:hypothetical protein